MADPRLNSIHLDPTRRQEFRRVRDALLNSRGNQTLYAENQGVEESPSATCIRNEGDAPVGLDYWLVDRDFIYPLKAGVNTLGRSADNDVVVDDSFISRRHCAILVHLNKPCEVYDTASKNGTYLNGNRLAGPAPLKPGDEIRICERRFVFLARTGEVRGPSPTQTLVE